MKDTKQLYPGIIPRGDSIQIAFNVPGHGRRRETVKLRPTEKNQLRCLAKLQAIKDEIAINTFTYENHFPQSKWVQRRKKTARGLTLHAVMKEWFDSKKDFIKPTSKKSYKSSISILTSVFGKDKLLGDLSPEDVHSFVKKRRGRGAATKTIAVNLAGLRGALETQTSLPVAQKLLLLDAATNLKKTLFEKETKKPLKPFDLSEMHKILDEVGGADHALIKFYFGSGARSGEAFSLCWEDIDLDNKTVSIVTNLSAGVYSTPKHESSRRLPLGGMAWEAIMSQRERTFMLKPVQIGNFGMKRPVFYNPRTNKPWAGTGSLREQIWIPAVTRSGVRMRYQYHTRHSFASMALMYGKHPLWVSGHLGHVDMSLVIKTYGNYLEEADQLKDDPRMKHIFENAGAAKSLKYG